MDTTDPGDPTPSANRGGVVTEPAARPDVVPRAARWLVWSFLVAFVVCAVGGLEIWPLTGFRLFSSLRHDTRVTWVAETVGPDGSQSRLWFTDLPRAYQGFGLIMGGFARLPPSVRLATCEAWLAEARRVRSGVIGLRIYATAWQALPRIGDRARSPARDLAYACG